MGYLIKGKLMSNNDVDKSLLLTFKTIDVLGDVATSVLGTIENFSQANKKIEMQKLKIQLRQMEYAHQEKMQPIRNEHEKKMLAMQYRHDEEIFKQQCEIIKFALETAEKAFNRKMDFYQAQLDCLEEVYSRESNLLTEHITFLENERRERINDANQYALISNDLNKLEDKKSELYNAYLKSQGNLQDAIKYLEIEKSFNNAIGCMNKGMIERKE